MRITRKLILTASLMFLASACSLAQNAPATTKKDDLYAVALFASVREMDKSWGNIDDSDITHGPRTDYKHMFVESNPSITDGLPLQDGEYRVEYLDQQRELDTCKKLRKPFAILIIEPMRSDGSRLQVQVSLDYETHKGRKLMLGISEWSVVHFKYDCASQKFVFPASSWAASETLNMEGPERWKSRGEILRLREKRSLRMTRSKTARLRSRAGTASSAPTKN